MLNSFQHLSFAQTPEIDSLLTVISTAKEDTNKVNALNLLSEKSGWRMGNYDTAFYYAENAKQLAEKLKFKKGIADSKNNIGIIYDDQGKYPEALKNHFASLKIREEIGDKKGIASSYNGIGVIYQRQAKYPKALENNFVALKIREEIGDKRGVSASYNNIGNIYHEQGNYPEALKNHFASLKIREEIGDRSGIAMSYGNIGTIYLSQEDYLEALIKFSTSLRIKEEIGDKRGIGNSYGNIGNIYMHQGNYPEALKNHFASLKIKEETGDKRGIAHSYNNIGSVYHHQGNYPEALKNYFAALKIFEEIGYKRGIAGSANNIGDLYMMLNDKKAARKYLSKGMEFSLEIGEKDIIKFSYRSLSILDSAQSHYKSAYNNYKLFIHYRDSLVNEENTKALVQTEMQYEFDKQSLADSLEFAQKEVLKNVELEKQELELKKSENLKLFFIIASVLTLLLALFAYYGFRQKQSANLLLKERNQLEIENKKKAISIFSQQVSPEVAKELLSDSFKADSKKLFACLMFLDIRDFTPLVEPMSPSEIIQFQNDVFGFMITTISKHNGIINQFLGDGFMATFGAPTSSGNDSQNAVNASLEIVEILSKKCESGELPQIKIGIGLHSGDIVTGNVGTSERKQYSITGNTVILASRIEQLNKTFNSELLISKEVLDELDDSNLKTAKMGPVMLKGRAEPMEIIRLV